MEGDDGIGEPHPVGVEIVHCAQERVAQALGMEQPPGARDVEPPGDQLPDDVVRRLTMTGYHPLVVRPLVPDVRQAHAAGTYQLVQPEDAERRKQVLLEVLVLVVPPDEYEVRSELVYRSTGRTEAIQECRAMPVRRGCSLIVRPLLAHRGWPVCPVLPAVGCSRVCEIPPEVHVGHGLIGHSDVRTVRTTDRQHCSHAPHPSFGGRSPPAADTTASERLSLMALIADGCASVKLSDFRGENRWRLSDVCR